VVSVPTAERLALARSHVWPRLLLAYGLRAEAAPAAACELIVLGYAAADEAGLRGVETRLEAVLQRAIARGAGGRVVWLSEALVAERLGDRPRGHRAMGFRPGPTVPERAEIVRVTRRGCRCRRPGQPGARCRWRRRRGGRPAGSAGR